METNTGNPPLIEGFLTPATNTLPSPWEWAKESPNKISIRRTKLYLRLRPSTRAQWATYLVPLHPSSKAILRKWPSRESTSVNLTENVRWWVTRSQTKLRIRILCSTRPSETILSTGTETAPSTRHHTRLTSLVMLEKTIRDSRKMKNNFSRQMETKIKICGIISEIIKLSLLKQLTVKINTAPFKTQASAASKKNRTRDILPIAIFSARLTLQATWSLTEMFSRQGKSWAFPSLRFKTYLSCLARRTVRMRVPAPAWKNVKEKSSTTTKTKGVKYLICAR